MPTIIEEDSSAPTRLGRLIFLIAMPVIALSLMATLARQEDSPRSMPPSEAVDAVPASGTTARISYEDNYTLYILGSADDGQRLSNLGARGPGPDWYAYVSTPEEEAELMSARDEADWFRYAAGLPRIRVVDLRLASAAPISPPPAVP